MIIRGRVWCYGDNVDTGEIIGGKYSKVRDMAVLAEHCMESIDASFSKKVSPGDIMVGGKNFGCGSSREGAPIALQAAKIQAVVAYSFARIFYRNAINLGLAVFECPAIEKIQTGDTIEIDTEKGTLQVIGKEEIHKIEPIPKFMQEIIDAKGLIGYKKKILMERGNKRE